MKIDRRVRRRVRRGRLVQHTVLETVVAPVASRTLVLEKAYVIW